MSAVSVHGREDAHSPDTLTGRDMAPGAATVRTPALRYWRVQRAMLQEQLAERANVHTASIQRGENGQPQRLTTVARLAKALEVKPTDLMAQPPEG
jgi:DNA-binding XRE family transcriptional regulator